MLPRLGRPFSLFRLVQRSRRWRLLLPARLVQDQLGLPRRDVRHLRRAARLRRNCARVPLPVNFHDALRGLAGHEPVPAAHVIVCAGGTVEISLLSLLARRRSTAPASLIYYVILRCGYRHRIDSIDAAERRPDDRKPARIRSFGVTSGLAGYGQGARGRPRLARAGAPSARRDRVPGAGGVRHGRDEEIARAALPATVVRA